MRIVIASILFLAPFAALADEVGRAEFNSRTVILDGDQTWKYAETFDTAGPDCQPIASNIVPMEMCLEKATWHTVEIDSNFEKAFSSDSGFYIGLITEHIYIDRPTMKTVILENAQAGAGIEDLKGLKQTDRTINGKIWLQSSFAFEYDNVEINMENFMYSRDGFGTVQVAVWGASASKQAFLDAVEQIAATLRIVK